VILIHGYGVNAGFMDRMAEEILREIPDARVICPEAPDRMTLPADDHRCDLALRPPEEARNPPPELSPDMQREWFPITGAPAELHRAASAVAKRMNDFIDGQRDALGIGDKDIAIMGFSQGGAVALYTAFTRPAEVACVVGHSAIVIHTRDFTTRPPTLLVYGTDDRTLSEHQYENNAVAPLRAHLSQLEISVIKAMGHTTTGHSRALVANFIKTRLEAEDHPPVAPHPAF
jgi:phospholipase/carboxylesterase